MFGKLAIRTVVRGLVVFGVLGLPSMLWAGHNSALSEAERFQASVCKLETLVGSATGDRSTLRAVARLGDAADELVRLLSCNPNALRIECALEECVAWYQRSERAIATHCSLRRSPRLARALDCVAEQLSRTIDAVNSCLCDLRGEPVVRRGRRIDPGFGGGFGWGEASLRAESGRFFSRSGIDAVGPMWLERHGHGELRGIDGARTLRREQIDGFGASRLSAVDRQLDQARLGGLPAPSGLSRLPGARTGSPFGGPFPGAVESRPTSGADVGRAIMGMVLSEILSHR